jgi:GTP-binding protein
MLPVVAIIGRPNVGKSTLFNRITGTKQAVTADLAGTTRDRLYSKCSWQNNDFILVDTAGIEVGDVKDSVYAKLDSDVQDQVLLAVEEADLILFIVDVRVGITDQDLKAIKIVHRSKKPFVLAANKFDSDKYLSELTDLYKLGVDEIIKISAITGRGTGDLLDIITNKLENVEVTEKDIDLEVEGIRVSIAGRPNVGKSSLFNALIGKNKAVVSEIAGTTRDFTIASISHEEHKINFIDTAGIRRRGKIGKVEEGRTAGQIEKYSVLRSFKAIENSDVVLILIDPTEGLTAQDMHIAGFAKDQLKSVVVVVNKWDAVDDDDKDMSDYLNYFYSKITFLPFAPVVFVSAKTGKNISKIFDLIVHVHEARAKRVPTSELNLLLGDDILRKPPAAVKRVLPKINYITQADETPPTFIFFTNHVDLFHFSYRRFLENKIREHWDFDGTPINIIFKRKNREYNIPKGKKKKK